NGREIECLLFTVLAHARAEMRLHLDGDSSCNTGSRPATVTCTGICLVLSCGEESRSDLLQYKLHTPLSYFTGQRAPRHPVLIAGAPSTVDSSRRRDSPPVDQQPVFG